MANDPLDTLATKHSGCILLAARIALGLMFTMSGYGKIMNLGGFTGGMTQAGVPLASVMAPLGAIVELVGGVALIIGLRVRWASVALIAFVVVATLIAHKFWTFEGAARQQQRIQFMKNLTILGGLTALFIADSGRYAVDRLLFRRA